MPWTVTHSQQIILIIWRVATILVNKQVGLMRKMIARMVNSDAFPTELTDDSILLHFPIPADHHGGDIKTTTDQGNNEKDNDNDNDNGNPHRNNDNDNKNSKGKDTTTNTTPLHLPFP